MTSTDGNSSLASRADGGKSLTTPSREARPNDSKRQTKESEEPELPGNDTPRTETNYSTAKRLRVVTVLSFVSL